MVVTDKLVEHFPDIVDVDFTAYMEKELDDIAEGDLGEGADARASSTGRSTRALEKAEDTIERSQEELDELCPLCPTRGASPARSRSSSAASASSSAARTTRSAGTSATWTAASAPEPELLDETCPQCGTPAAAAGRPVRAVRRVQRLPGLQVHQEGPAEDDRRHVPAVQAGRAGREAEPVRHHVLQLRPVPGVRLRRRQPTGRRPPVPRVRLAAAAPPEVAALLELRRGAGSRVQRDQVRRRGGGGRRPCGEGDGEGRARRREAEEGAGEEDDRTKKTTAKKKSRRRSGRPRSASRRTRTRARRGGLGNGVQLRRRGRCAPRDPVGDPQGSPEPPRVPAAAGRHDDLLARGLGGVHGGRGARDAAGLVLRHRGARSRRRRHDGAHAARRSCSARSPARWSTASTGARS